MNIIDIVYKWATPLSNRNKTKFIVCHHAKAKICSVEDIHSWHLANGWSGIGYHFFIRKNGTIYKCRPINTIGAHVEGRNHDSLGICFEGDFEQEYPTKQQKESGVELIRYLRNLYQDVLVVRHKDVGASTCPGRCFDDNIILEGLMDMPQEHWGEEVFKKLYEKGIIFTDKRFDDKPTRAELMASILKIAEYVDEKLKK